MKRSKFELSPSILIAKILLNKEKATFGEIRELTGFVDSTIAVHLKKLGKKKIITSSRHPEDRRKVLYQLNPEELAFVSKKDVIKEIREELKRVNERLTKEEKKELENWLIQYLRPIVINLVLAYPREVDVVSAVDLVVVLRKILDVKRSLSETEEEIRVSSQNKNAYFDAVLNIPESFYNKWCKRLYPPS